jgi:maltose alpha-D-glucosyltransferase/alpha-amylase
MSADLAHIMLVDGWQAVLTEVGRRHVEDALLTYLPRCRWFQSKARTLREVRIQDSVPMEQGRTHLLFLSVLYEDRGTELYVLPLKFLPTAEAETILKHYATAAVAGFQAMENDQLTEEGYLIDAIHDPAFQRRLLDIVRPNHTMKGLDGSVTVGTTRAFDDVDAEALAGQSRLLGREQSNTSIKYGDALILKLMRKLESGVNPELEIGRFLTEQTDMTHVPLLSGYMEYRRGEEPASTLAVLQGFVSNEGDAWEYTLDWLESWFEPDMLASKPDDIPDESFVTLAQQATPRHAQEHIGLYLDQARLLGQRTGELHVALASGQSDAFRPEPFSMTYQQSLYGSIMQLCDRVFSQLRTRLNQLPEAVRPPGQAVLEEEADIRETFEELNERDIPGQRIRTHGDYHLGQVLYTGDDFVIVDFEGEPARPLPERYIKHSPLRDVAGMLRSFHYAAYAVLPGFGVRSVVPQDQFSLAEPWVRYWRNWTSVAFLRQYMHTVTPADILPPEVSDIEALLRILLMEKAVYELGYEINNRPGWLRVPAQAIIRQID